MKTQTLRAKLWTEIGLRLIAVCDPPDPSVGISQGELRDFEVVGVALEERVWPLGETRKLVTREITNVPGAVLEWLLATFRKEIESADYE